MRSRREFIQLASVSAMLLAAKSWSSVAAKQKLSIEDLLDFDTKGQVTLLHLTDLHGQLKPIYFRPPSENFGVGKYEGIPPHLVGEAFLKHFNKNKKALSSVSLTRLLHPHPNKIQIVKNSYLIAQQL